MIDKSAKSLRWLANQFPAVEAPSDDTDRLLSCIHLYCTAGADAIDTLTASLAALKAENEEKDKEIERLNEMLADSFQGHLLEELRRKDEALSRVEAERDAAVELVGKLERCLLFISTAPEYREGGMVFRHTVDYAEAALAQWRGALGEEGQNGTE